MKDRERIKDRITLSDVEIASKVGFFYSMDLTQIAADQGKLDSLRVYQRSGIYYTEGRARQALEELLGVPRLPVLMPQSRLSYLIMWEAHSQDHRQSPSDSLARSRETAWVVRGGSLAKTISRCCPRCRRENKKFSKQMMADIPRHQLIPCSPFTHVSIDFLGPYEVRGVANKRAKVKVFGLVIVCQNTRAVKLMAVPGYDTYSFLLAYVRFTSDHGSPRLVVSDRGTQLVRAGKMINEKVDHVSRWDWKTIKDLQPSLGRSGFSWKLAASGVMVWWSVKWPA